MSQKAYLLIEAEVGRSPEVLDHLSRLSGVVEAHVILGAFSLIAIIEGPDTNAVGRLIAERVHAVPGLLRTVSCFVLETPDQD